MIPKISALSPTSDSRAPTGSSGVCVSSRESGANTHTAATTARAIGTFTSRVEPHQKPSSRPPVTIGPSDAAGAGEAGPDGDGLAPARGAGRST